MQPFEISEDLDCLRETHPPLDIVLKVAGNGDRNSQYAMCRLWLSEGIPFAFKARPGTYEAIRIWLARRLNIEAKQITIIGSGRQGYSLSPDKNLGRSFGAYSDLDFSAASLDLFERLSETFFRWSEDYAHGRVSPRNEREQVLWDDNKQRCPYSIKRGFIDPYKIPTFHDYPEAKKVAQALYEINEKLKVTPEAPNIRKTSLRVYRDWDSFVCQMAINLKAAAKYATKLETD